MSVLVKSVLCFFVSTKSAVKFFKRGRLELARAYLDYALDIDDINVEGLVARGAL